MTDKFSGTYELRVDGWYGGWKGKPRFEFTNDPRQPLTYDDSVLLMRPDNHFMTDLGSVPRFLQKAVPIWFDRARFPKSYIFHDSAYLHGGHWCGVKGHGFKFTPMTRKKVDELLRDMILAEGGSKMAARLIHAGVRMGGWKAWRRKLATG